jgi:hypothetical protein
MQDVEGARPFTYHKSMDFCSLLCEIRYVDDRVFAEAIRAVNPEGLVDGPLGLAIRIVATCRQQFSFAQILKERSFSTVGMHVCHLAGIGDPDQPPVFFRQADRQAHLEMVKITPYFILSVFNVY